MDTSRPMQRYELLAEIARIKLKPKPSLKQSYADWFGTLPFTAYGHFTWKSPVSHKAAKRNLERFLKVAGGFGAFGFERGHKSNLLHAHALLAMTVSCRSAWRWWFKNYGRNLIEPIDENLSEAGRLYVCKYSVKDECLEFLGNWSKLKSLQLGLEKLP